jgi:hypothetical protein
VSPICRLWIFGSSHPFSVGTFGEKSAPVVGLNDVFGIFRQVLEVVESPFAEVFESAAYANFATPAALRIVN